MTICFDCGFYIRLEAMKMLDLLLQNTFSALEALTCKSQTS